VASDSDAVLQAPVAKKASFQTIVQLVSPVAFGVTAVCFTLGLLIVNLRLVCCSRNNFTNFGYLRED
jgi:hypothetical protein